MNMIHEEFAALRPVELDTGQVFSKKSGTVVRGDSVPSSYTPAIDIGEYRDDVVGLGCFWANLFGVEAVRYIGFSKAA